MCMIITIFFKRGYLFSESYKVFFLIRPIHRLISAFQTTDSIDSVLIADKFF